MLTIDWIKSFAFTLIIEVPVFVWMARHYEVTFGSMFDKNASAPFLRSRSGVPLWRGAVAGAWGTCMTHPVLWFFWSRFYVGTLDLLLVPDHLREEFGRSAIFQVMTRGQVFYSGVMIAEVLIACIESLTFWVLARKISLARAIAGSFLANAASYGVGQLVRYLWPGFL